MGAPQLVTATSDADSGAEKFARKRRGAIYIPNAESFPLDPGYHGPNATIKVKLEGEQVVCVVDCPVNDKKKSALWSVSNGSKVMSGFSCAIVPEQPPSKKNRGKEYSVYFNQKGAGNRPVACFGTNVKRDKFLDAVKNFLKTAADRKKDNAKNRRLYFRRRCDS